LRCFRLMWVAALFWGAPAASGLNPEHRLTQYVHRIWQTQPGLPQTAIFAVSQTRDGYLWLGTESGVVRFDGVRFTPVPELEGAQLDDIRARAFVEDARGRVWIVSSTLGLVRMDGQHVKVFTPKDGLPRGETSCAFTAQTGEVWICTSSGMARFEGDRLQTYGQGLRGRPLAGCQTPDSMIWIAGDGWVASSNGSQFTSFPLRSIPPGAGVRSLVCRDDGVWVGTMRGLIHFSGGKERRFTNENGLPDAGIMSLAKGSRGELWIGTRNGLSRYVNGAFESFTYGDGLSQKDVYSIYEDREGSLWVATKYGLNEFLDGPATRFTRNQGLPSNNVGPVLEDRSGNLWVGFLDAGLARWNGRRFSLVQNLVSPKVTTLMESADGSLWVGTDQGLTRMEAGEVKETFDVQRGLPSNRIHSLYMDHSGTIWVGTEKGAAMYRDGGFVEPAGFTSSTRVPIVAIGETRNRELLFAAERGNVYVLANGKLSVLKDGVSPGGSPLTNVISIHGDKDGLIWMGTTMFGLRLLRDGKIHRFLRTDGLFDGEIYGFVSDSGGQLWMVGSKGLSSVAKSDLLAFSEGKIKKIKTSPYVPLEGPRAIQGRDGVQPSAITGRDGKLWFTTLEGLIAYEPNWGTDNNPTPPVLIEDVTVGGQHTLPSAVHRLGPGKENLAFRYTSFSFLAPESMTFRYILEGYDRDWTDAGTRREAFYMNLPAGTFRFRVTACAPFVPCNDVGSAVEFQVIPSIYQRNWFWPLIGAILSLFVWLAHRLRIARLQSEFSLVVAERVRIARELHDTLIQGFSGITMQMQALSDRLRPSRDKQFLDDIIRDAGDSLRETRESVAGLREGETASPALAVAIAETVEAITKEYDLRLVLNLDRTPRNISAGIKHNLVRIVQEAVLNAAKHSGATTIEVSLNYFNDELRLAVSDDGRGMEYSSPHGESHHYGIIGMKERADHIGAEFDLVSTAGLGTTIGVRILADKKALSRLHPDRLETFHEP
jgi:signal transduction histidine kinase/ligand-binding sensor domain-containing protein